MAHQGLKLVIGFQVISVIGAGMYIDTTLKNARALALARASDLQYSFSKDLPKFLADQEALAHVPFFTEKATSARNAGAILNPLVEWKMNDALSPSDDQKSTVAQWNSSHARHVEISDDIKRKIDTPDAGWADAAASTPQVEDVNLNWMHGLPDYDHWDLESNSAFEELVIRSPDMEPPYSWPDFSGFTEIAKVRMLQGERHGEIGTASAEVYALAKLLYSTENYGAAQAAMSVLQSGIMWSSYLAAKGIAPPKEWSSIDQATVVRAGKYLATYPYLYYIFMPNKMTSDIYLNPNSGVGSCMAVNLMRELQWPTHGLLKELENSSGLYTVLASLGAGCRPHLVNALWQNPTRLSHAITRGPHRPLLMSVPWFREIAGYQIYSRTRTTPFMSYDE